MLIISAIRLSLSLHILGQLQPKHAWLRPLIAFGATAHLLRVSGTGDPRKYYGCNVASGHVGLTIKRLRKAGGDGTNGTATLPIGWEDMRLWGDRRGITRANVPHVVRHSPTGIE